MTNKDRNRLCRSCLDQIATEFYAIDNGKKVKRGLCRSCYERAVKNPNDMKFGGIKEGPTINRRGAEEKGRKQRDMKAIGGTPIDEERDQ